MPAQKKYDIQKLTKNSKGGIMQMKILAIGDIVGEGGLKKLKEILPRSKTKRKY